jgi:hypothetical protein
MEFAMRIPATAAVTLVTTIGLLAACSGPGRGPLTTRPVQPNPAGPAATATDVAAWQAGDAGTEALFVAAGPSGLDVNRADGSHLQRLGSTPLSRLVVVQPLVVGGVPADFLVAADPDAGVLRGFEIHPQTGALRRIARSSGGPGAPVSSLCAWRDAEGGQRLVFTTTAPALEEWAVSAAPGKIPDKANELVATLLRSSPLAEPAVDCAVDPAGGDVYLIGEDGRTRRVHGDWQAPAAPQPVWTDTGFELRGIEALQTGGATVFLATAADAALVALSPDGRVLGRTPLDVPAGRLAAAGGLLVLVAADGSGARIAPLGEALRRVGAAPRPAP